MLYIKKTWNGMIGQAILILEEVIIIKTREISFNCISKSGIQYVHSSQTHVRTSESNHYNKEFEYIQTNSSGLQDEQEILFCFL